MGTIPKVPVTKKGDLNTRSPFYILICITLKLFHMHHQHKLIRLKDLYCLLFLLH